jgi:hypothetical protein
MDNSPYGQLAPWTRPMDNSPHGQLVPLTSRPMDISAHGHFAQGCFAPQKTRPMDKIHPMKNLSRGALAASGEMSMGRIVVGDVHGAKAGSDGASGPGSRGEAYLFPAGIQPFYCMLGPVIPLLLCMDMSKNIQPYVGEVVR